MLRRRVFLSLTGLLTLTGLLLAFQNFVFSAPDNEVFYDGAIAYTLATTGLTGQLESTHQIMLVDPTSLQISSHTQDGITKWVVRGQAPTGEHKYIPLSLVTGADAVDFPDESKKPPTYATISYPLATVAKRNIPAAPLPWFRLVNYQNAQTFRQCLVQAAKVEILNKRLGGNFLALQIQQTEGHGLKRGNYYTGYPVDKYEPSLLPCTIAPAKDSSHWPSQLVNLLNSKVKVLTGKTLVSRSLFIFNYCETLYAAPITNGLQNLTSFGAFQNTYAPINGRVYIGDDHIVEAQGFLTDQEKKLLQAADQVGVALANETLTDFFGVQNQKLLPSGRRPSGKGN